MVYPIYVISHSDLFREGLNAVAAFCGSSGFRTATWMGASIGILLTALAYVKQHDLLVYLRWLVTYFFVFNVLLGIPTTVSVVNTSDQTVPPAVVDNVPFGLAFPAYLITSIGYGFTQDMETVFALPEESQYQRTGMLFGSTLFRLSTAAAIRDRDLLTVMEQYVKNCVVGDVLVNHKYSWDTLAQSTDLWGLMTSNPSPIRGLYLDGVFATCQQAAKTLTAKMNDYASKRAPEYLSRQLPSQNPYAATAVNRYLVSSYQYFTKASQSATEIFRQNLAINLFRSGIQTYARETGSVTSLPVIANTEAMAKTRMAWASSRHIGIQTLPLMQVVLLLLLLCLFPLVALLTLLPNVGMNVFKQYVYSLLWLESWPILYAILNMAMNFYLHGRSIDTVTLANTDLLAQSHSDIAGIAGYLVLAIPFLSLGIVRGMAFTFNNAAQYLGGMMHSIAQNSAASVVTGNYSLGNVSTDNATANNVNANKHDTNFTNLHGMNTQQVGNASLMSTTPMGDAIVNTASGMSQLATSSQAAQSASESLSQQVDSALNLATQHHSAYATSRNHSNTLGSGFSSSDSAQVDQAMTTLNSLSSQVAEREHTSQQDSFQKMTKMALSGSLNGSMAPFLNNKLINLGLSGVLQEATEGTSNHQGSYSTDVNRDMTANEAKDFRQALNTVQHYAQTHSLSDQNSDAENLAIQTGADLNNAQRLSQTAQYVESHANTINTNFSQAFANHVREILPNHADVILSATGNSELLHWQQALANEFIQTHAEELGSQFAADSVNVQRGDASPIMQRSREFLVENYQQQSNALEIQGDNLGVNAQQADALKSAVQQQMQHNQATMREAQEKQSNDTQQLQTDAAEKIRKEEAYAKAGVHHHVLSTLTRGLKE